MISLQTFQLNLVLHEVQSVLHVYCEPAPDATRNLKESKWYKTPPGHILQYTLPHSEEDHVILAATSSTLGLQMI